MVNLNVDWSSYLLFVLSEVGSHYVDQESLKLTENLLPLPVKGGVRYASLYLAKEAICMNE